MYNVKGFLRIDNQQNNTINVVSMLGELSTQSMTYSTEKGIYRNDSTPGIGFVSFTSKHDNNSPIPVPQNYVDHILQVCYKMITYSSAYGDSVTTQAIANDILNTFQGNIFDLEMGPLVSTPTLSLPEWISWQNPIFNTGLNRIKIWLSDQAFKRQFDDYEVLLVNPVDTLMDLVRDVSITTNALALRTRDKEMELIAAIKNGNPETNIRAQQFTLKHPLQPNTTFNITWYAVIYGIAGDNPDIIKEAIIQELLNNTDLDSDVWRAVIPELFDTTEFTLVPKWMKQAIPDRTIQAGIYSPFSSINEELLTMISLYNDIDPDHITQYLEVLSIPYRSLMIYSLAGVHNLDNLFKLSTKYPDLLNVGTASADFSRMSIKTQDFANALEELIIIAENETDYADLPVYVRRITRYGKTWMTRNFQGVQFLVYTKSNDTGL